MNNYLFTKYKAAVQNNRLARLGYYNVLVGAGTFSMTSHVEKDSITYFDNNVDVIKVGPDVVTSPWTSPFNYSAVNNTRYNGTLTRDTLFEIPGRYLTDCVVFEGTSEYTIFEPIEDIIASAPLKIFTVGFGCVINGLNPIDASIFDGKEMTEITIQNHPSLLKGNLSSLANVKTLEKFIINGAGEFVGNINVLANMKGLTYLSVQRNTNITGSIEELVAGQMAVDGDTAGRNSGSISAVVYLSGITFNGSAIPQTTGIITIEFGASGAAVRDGNNTLMGTYTKNTNSWAYPGSSVIN